MPQDQDNPNALLEQIRESIDAMQSKMQGTYGELTDEIVTGVSTDGSVKIALTATYGFHDIEFTKNALQGGIAEFKERIRSAWKSACEKVQKVTQAKTMELLQSMQIPDEIRQLSEGNLPEMITEDEDKN